MHAFKFRRPFGIPLTSAFSLALFSALFSGSNGYAARKCPDLLAPESGFSARKSGAVQDAEERELREEMRHILAQGLAYKTKGSGRLNLAAYVDQLPISERRVFVLELLRAHGDSAEGVTAIVARLDPVPGVREAVANFLAESKLLSEGGIAFNDGQIRRMFEGPRYKRFFPWLVGDAINLTVYPGEKLLMTVKTSPFIPVEHGLDPKFLAQGYMSRRFYETVIPRPVVRQTVGYDPLVLPRILVDQLNADFHLDGMLPADQIHGLTVQGAYESGGHSLYVDFAERRGVADIESDVPKIAKALRSNLESGALSRVPGVESRLFTYGWAMNANGNLIGSLRQTALRIADLEKDFVPLRIRIHSFPTRTLYDEVVRYREAYLGRAVRNPQAVKELDQCVAEMEGVLGIGNGARTFSETLKGFKLSAGLQNSILSIAGDFEKAGGVDSLERLAEIRKRLRGLRNGEGKNRLDAYDYYLIDREISGLAMTAAKKRVDDLPADLDRQFREAAALGRQIIRQVEADDFLLATQVESYLAQLDLIETASGLDAARKLELVSDLFGNTVDQVYYGLKRIYGEFDERVLRLAARPGQATPVRFLDGTLRSGNVFMLSQLVDVIEESLMTSKNLTHEIAGKGSKLPVRVFNPGDATGILRINKDAMELTTDEIGVFSEMPTESAALGGIITIGTGAKLSHLQLLAKALKVPNIKGSADLLAELRRFDGKRVRILATKEGAVKIVPVADGLERVAAAEGASQVEVPVPNHAIDRPVTFRQAARHLKDNIAGPKGITLSELLTDARLAPHLMPGFILPFGFFDRYVRETGVKPLIEELAGTELSNGFLVAKTCAKIRKKILGTDVPAKMLDEVMASLEDLRKETGLDIGNFFRSDTNIEDLPGFNGAGLNESVPNVAVDRAEVANAIRKVWASAFKEKSISWRGRALGATFVPIAEPSIVVLPTLFAHSSGVILSRGTAKWEPGKGLVSANWGIGSVVEAGAPVEEITLEANRPIRSSLTSSNTKPTAKAKGGIKFTPAEPGQPVLTEAQILELNATAMKIEEKLGRQPHGYDIEWVFDANGKLWIVQARPNM